MTGKTINVLLVDTEGLGDTEKSTNHDIRIFTLAVLLSSHTVYNCTGVIDNNLITQLSLVGDICKTVRLSNSDEHAPG